MPYDLLNRAPLFLLVCARCFTLIMSLPLFSSRTVPRIAKITLVIYMATFISPMLSLSEGNFAQYGQFISNDGKFNMIYVLLLVGEGLLGIIIGFYLQVIFGAFSTAGQFFAFQMGFSASEVYDSLSQVENPLMGQYLNLIAMLVFMQNRLFQKLFLGGLVASFNTINAFNISSHTDQLMSFMLKSLSVLFVDALIIALPIMGTLFLINVTMGILSKAAPQMNLLSEGFPIMILVSFFIITVLLPDLTGFFMDSFDHAFVNIERLFMRLRGGVPA